MGQYFVDRYFIQWKIVLTQAMSFARKDFFRYHKSRDSFFSDHILVPRVAVYEDNHFPPPLLSRRNASTKRADTSRACTCNILVSTISRSALCRFHRLWMRKRKSIYTYVEVIMVRAEWRDKRRVREFIINIYENFYFATLAHNSRHSERRNFRLITCVHHARTYIKLNLEQEMIAIIRSWIFTLMQKVIFFSIIFI